MISEVAALARFFTGWSKADLMALSVRERRYWMRLATWVTSRNRDGR